MSQYLVPIETTTGYFDAGGGWVNQAIPVTNHTLFNEVDEDFNTPNDANTDYCSATVNSTPTQITFQLHTGSDPFLSTGHIIRWRGRSATNGKHVQMELRQGYVSEGNKGTLIATSPSTALTTSFADYSYTLSGPEADSITDYTSLYLRYIAVDAGGMVNDLSVAGLSLPDPVITGSGSSDVALADTQSGGKVFWNVSGSSDVVVSDSGTGEDKGAAATAPMQVVVGIDVDSGDTVSGIILGINNDLSLHVAVQLQPAGTGQQLRWAKEVNMDRATVVHTIP